MKVGEKMIDEVIKSLNISQRKAATLIGMPLRTLENWLAGVRTPPEWLEQLAAEELARKVNIAEATTSDSDNEYSHDSLGDIVNSLGLSGCRAAMLIGMPSRTLLNWLSGQRIPSEWVERLVVAELVRKANAAGICPANGLKE